MTTIDSWEQYRVKTCPKCGETKSMDDFYHNENRYDKCNFYCKKCVSSDAKLYRQKYPRKVKSSFYKTQYGITLEQKEEIIKQQKGCCYLCDNTLPDNPKYRHVEHDKTTGQIYGVSHHNCNIGIAMFNHDPMLMVKVAKRMIRLRVQNGENK